MFVQLGWKETKAVAWEFKVAVANFKIPSLSF